jgi:hypothetical protein
MHVAIDGRRASATMALLGGFISIFYVFHYMQVLSYSLGAYYEIGSMVSANSINATPGMLSVLAGSSSVRLALYLTYVLLPFALVMLTIGVLWFFARAYSKLTGAMLLLTSIMYLLITAVLENNFVFHSTWLGIVVVSAGGALVLIASIHALGTFSGTLFSVPDKARRRPVQIEIDPELPYTNMQVLSSKLMGRLSGEIKILDMHFDVTALDNLMRLVSKNTSRYSRIDVLSKKDRLGEEFAAAYKDFKSELISRRVEFELRVLNDDDALKQHERFLLDNSEAYKIPPLNIINRKSEHITSVNRVDAAKRFDDLWSRAIKFENRQG